MEFIASDNSALDDLSCERNKQSVNTGFKAEATYNTASIYPNVLESIIYCLLAALPDLEESLLASNSGYSVPQLLIRDFFILPTMRENRVRRRGRVVELVELDRACVQQAHRVMRPLLSREAGRVSVQLLNSRAELPVCCALIRRPLNLLDRDMVSLSRSVSNKRLKSRLRAWQRTNGMHDSCWFATSH